MPTVLRMLGWKAEGLRCPDHEIDCCDSGGNPHRISLIQMPNGTGKTTTLNLLRAALSGGATQWEPARIRDFRKRNPQSDAGTFVLRLSVNGKRLTVTMEFDFDRGRVDYRTTFGSGQEDGFRPPLELRRFMNADFVNFFVFDGELAENLLNQRHTDAEKAVESLFQVHLLDRMSAKVSEYWEEKTSTVRAREERGYSRRKNKLDEWRSRLAKLEEEKARLETSLTSTSAQLKRQQDRYNSEIAKEQDRAKEIRSAEAKMHDLKGKVGDCAQRLLDGMREPQALSPAFAESMYELKDGLDRVKLPESAAREFFEELAGEIECVCGRPIDNEIRDVIRTRAQQYLGSDDVSLLNAMKSAIADAVGLSREAPAAALSVVVDDLSALVSSFHTALNELDELKHAAEQADPDVMQAKEEIERLASERDRLEHELRKFDGKDEKLNLERISKVDLDRVYSIESIKEGIELLERQVAEVTDTLVLRDKRDVLKRIIDAAHVKARDALSSEIRDEANERIDKLMPYNNIRIDRIARCLVLRGQTGGSAGETLSVGYAFLSTLFNRADQHQLPFIVDSPAGPIDFDIRGSIGELVPKLTDQFIAFMISSEREKFLSRLKKASTEEIQYITLFRKGATHLEAKAATMPACIATSDGLQVASESFFNEFQLDEEEAA